MTQTQTEPPDSNYSEEILSKLKRVAKMQKIQRRKLIRYDKKDAQIKLAKIKTAQSITKQGNQST